MPVKGILQEARKLGRISESLDLLALQHAPVGEALSIVSGNVRNSGARLEVRVALRLGQMPGIGSASN
jgi:hypothetical protein